MIVREVNSREIREMSHSTFPEAPVLLEVRPGVYRKCTARITLAQRIGDFYTEHDGITDEDAVNVGPCVVIEQF